MSERLTDILACPVCKGPLAWQREAAGIRLPRGPARVSRARRHPGDAAGRGEAPRIRRRRADRPLTMFRVVIPGAACVDPPAGQAPPADRGRADDPARAAPRAAFRRRGGRRRDRRRAHPRRLPCRGRRGRDDRRLTMPRARIASRKSPARRGWAGRGHRRQRPGRRTAAAAGPDRPGGGAARRDAGRGDRDAGNADPERSRIPGPERGQGRRAPGRDGALFQPRADTLGPRWRGATRRGRRPSPRQPPAPRALRVSRRRAPRARVYGARSRSSGANGSNSCARSPSDSPSSSRMQASCRARASTRRRTSRARMQSCGRRGRR